MVHAPDVFHTILPPYNLADMKAIQEGNVWGIQKNYWQSADDVATMIEDIATIIYHPEDADQLHYFYKLPAE